MLSPLIGKMNAGMWKHQSGKEESLIPSLYLSMRKDFSYLLQFYIVVIRSLGVDRMDL